MLEQFESKDSINEDNEGHQNYAISFDMTLFHYPQDFACPIQQKKGNEKFDKLVKLQMKQLQILHMQQVTFRLNDYFFFQLIFAATDASPYSDIISRLKVELDPFSENQGKGAGAIIEIPEDFNESGSCKSSETSSLATETLEPSEIDSQSRAQINVKSQESNNDDYYTSSDSDHDQKESEKSI